MTIYRNWKDARKAAELLQTGETEFRYIVKSDPEGSGKAVIRVYQADTNEFVETF